MNVIIQQILFLIFIFPIITHSKNSCPNSTCANSFLPIKYPFKLETDHPPKSCYNFIDLRCDDQGHVIINLPSSGDFYVTYIDYYLQRIALTDPGNCLLGRLMTNFSVYPLDAFFYENYTYYSCPKERVRRPFSEIHCLSKSTNATIATTGLSSEFMEEVFGCEPIVSSLIPVSWSSEYNSSENSGDLQLTWNVPGCRECEEYDPPNSGDSKSKLAKFVGSPLFITSTALVTFLAIACLLRIMELIAGRATTDNTTANNTTEDAAATPLSATTNTTVAPTQTTGDPPAVPPGTTNGTVETENFEVKNYSEVAVLSENQGTLATCSICLEEYHGKDRVGNLVQCGHYFHAECIGQWLQKNTTCPVCRTSLSNF